MAPGLTLEHFRERLAAVHAAQRQARSEAFVPYVPVLAGQRLEPITLDRYNRLMAFGSPFVCGGPRSLDDLLVFVWILHPSFSQFDHRARRACYRASLRALRPRFPVLNALARLLAAHPRLRWLDRFTVPDSEQRLTDAMAEASRLVREAVAEFPRASEEGEPLPFAFQAQTLNLLRRELGVSFAEARALPMRELCQHVRELLHHGSRGKATMLTSAEAAVWRDYEAWADSVAAARN
jgi:hypothetical protein